MLHLIISSLEPFTLDYARPLAIMIALVLILLLSLIVHTLLHRAVLPVIQRQADNSSRHWLKSLMLHRLFNRLALLLQGILLHIQTTLFLADSGSLGNLLLIIAQLWILFFALLLFFSVLDMLLSLSVNSGIARQLPLRGIFQSLKLVAAIIVLIMLISLLMGKSPLVLITGLGAMTAVLMLVFKDPILGLVAGIQLSVNDMLKINDWLEMPKYDADGAVIDVGLTTVKVRNWDNTITTIPTYALISDSFKNWRAMSESGGRRIKRSINIDTTSIHFLSDDEIRQLSEAQLLAPYINHKLSEVTAFNARLACDINSPLNGRRLTNIGTFRAWLRAYLKEHPSIHSGMTVMVRQLAPGSEGLPIEIYAFTNTTVWAEYENIQSDIFDHIFAILPAFGLRVHQIPTGNDLRHIGLTNQEQHWPSSMKAGNPKVTTTDDDGR